MRLYRSLAGTIYIYINFNDNGRPGDPYVKSTDKYIYKYTLVKVKSLRFLMKLEVLSRARTPCATLT